MHIGPCGDVFPCFSYNMGNIRKNSLMQIWNGDKYRKFRRQLQQAGVRFSISLFMDKWCFESK